MRKAIARVTELHRLYEAVVIAYIFPAEVRLSLPPLACFQYRINSKACVFEYGYAPAMYAIQHICIHIFSFSVHWLINCTLIEFLIRFQEIASELEDALTDKSLTPPTAIRMYHVLSRVVLVHNKGACDVHVGCAPHNRCVWSSSNYTPQIHQRCSMHARTIHKLAWNTRTFFPE